MEHPSHFCEIHSFPRGEIPDGTCPVTDRDRPRWAVRYKFPEMDFLSWDNLYLNHPWNAWYSLSEYPSSLANLSTKIIETCKLKSIYQPLQKLWISDALALKYGIFSIYAHTSKHKFMKIINPLHIWLKIYQISKILIHLFHEKYSRPQMLFTRLNLGKNRNLCIFII